MSTSHPLREYRKEHGLSLEAMASEADTTAATISRIERRKQKPSLDLLARLKRVTGLATDVLVEAAE